MADLIKRDPQVNVIELLQQAIATKADVEVMRGLFELQRDVMAQHAKQEFDEALNRLQAKIPQIDKLGLAKNSKYAKLDDIDVIVRPLMAEEGFSVSISEEAKTGKDVTFAMELAHKSGHSKTIRRTFSTDVASQNSAGKSIRPAIQDDGSTTHYARRYLLAMHLNIVTKGADTDGESTETVTPEQAIDIKAKLEEVAADVPGFLKWMHIESLDQIRASDLKKVYDAIEEKRRGKARPK